MRFPGGRRVRLPARARDPRRARRNRRARRAEHLAPALRLGRQADELALALDEPVAEERLDCFRVERCRLTGRFGHEREKCGAALPERALEARLLAEGLEAATPRRAALRKRAGVAARNPREARPSRRGPSAPARTRPRTRDPCAPAPGSRSCPRAEPARRERSCGSRRRCRRRRPGSRVKSSGHPSSAITRAARCSASARRL